MFQIHYTPRQGRTDRSKIGVIFLKDRSSTGTPGHRQQPLRDRTGRLEQRGQVFTFRRTPSCSRSCTCLPARTQVHAVPKDGPPEVLLSVPAYDFGWQSYYHLDKSRKLPAGTRIDCVAHFDNSKENPANPDPSKKVTWGDQTFEEMMIGYIDFYDADPIGPATPVARTGEPILQDASTR